MYVFIHVYSVDQKINLADIFILYLQSFSRVVGGDDPPPGIDVGVH